MAADVSGCPSAERTIPPIRPGFCWAYADAGRSKRQTSKPKQKRILPYPRDERVVFYVTGLDGTKRNKVSLAVCEIACGEHRSDGHVLVLDSLAPTLLAIDNPKHAKHFASRVADRPEGAER